MMIEYVSISIYQSYLYTLSLHVDFDGSYNLLTLVYEAS